MDHRESGCGLEEVVPRWIRLREEKRQPEIMPWLLTGMTRWMGGGTVK